MNCNCITEMLEKVKEASSDQLPKNALEGSLKVRWANVAFRMDTGKAQIMIPITAEYQRAKSSGETYKNKSTETINIAPSFCPFCGEKTRGEK